MGTGGIVVMKRSFEPHTTLPEKRRKHSNVHLGDLLEVLQSLDLPSLHFVIAHSTALVQQHIPALPMEVWTLIFSNALTSNSSFFNILASLFRLKAVSSSWLSMIDMLLNQLPASGFPNAILQRSVYFSAVVGNSPVLSYLLNWPKASLLGNFALQLASCFGHSDIVAKLLDHSEVTAGSEENLALRLAIETNHIAAIKDLSGDWSVRPDSALLQSFDKIRAFGVDSEVPILLLPHLSDSTKEELLVFAAESNYPEVVELLLVDERVVPDFDESLIFRRAAAAGNTEIVSMLLQDPRISPDSHDNFAIQIASQIGAVEVVSLLLSDPRVSPEAGNNDAIQMASKYGHKEVVKLLLQDSRVDPTALNNRSIQNAARHGHYETVSLLLADPRVSPQANHNYAVCVATQQGHSQVSRLLLEDPRVLQQDTEFLLIHALDNNDLEMVEYLCGCDFIDPSLHDNYAFRKALDRGFERISVFLSNFLEPGKLKSILLERSDENRIHATWDCSPYWLANQCYGDVFSIDEENVSDGQIAQKWAEQLNLGRPISWQATSRGHFKAFSLPFLESDVYTRHFSKTWEPIDNRMAIFSLICEPKPSIDVS